MPYHRRSPGFKKSESPNKSRSESNYSRNDSHRTTRFDPIRSKDIFRSVCISNIPNKVSEERLKDFVDEEFSKFGRYNLSISQYLGKRVAYVNFNDPSNARDAIEDISHLEIDGKPVSLKPIFHNCHSIKRFSPFRSRSPTRKTSNRKQSYNDVSSDHSEHISRSNSPRGNYRENLIDHRVTRTLFVGNLSVNVTEDDLLERFSSYGEVINVDLKKQSSSAASTTFAFIRYPNLDMAATAKRCLENRSIFGSVPKFGFAKVNPTQCVFLNGLGPWLDFEDLEKYVLSSCRRGGSRGGGGGGGGHGVRRINWPRNRSFAFVVCDSTTEAQRIVETLQSSNSTHEGGRFSNVNVGYCEMSYYRREFDSSTASTSVNSAGGGGGGGGAPSATMSGSGKHRSSNSSGGGGSYRHHHSHHSSGHHGNRVGGGSSGGGHHHHGHGHPPPPPPSSSSHSRRRRSTSSSRSYLPPPPAPASSASQSQLSSTHQGSRRSPLPGGQRSSGSVAPPMSVTSEYKTAQQIMDRLRPCWTGKLCLKRYQMGLRLHRIRGDEALIPSLLPSTITLDARIPITVSANGGGGGGGGGSNSSMGSNSSSRLLRDISYKLDSLRGRKYCLMLGGSHCVSTTLIDDALHPQKPLSNLVEYLTSKRSIGACIIQHRYARGDSHSGSSRSAAAAAAAASHISDGTTALIVFPPSEFVYDMVGKKISNMAQKPGTNDFIMALLIKDVII